MTLSNASFELFDDQAPTFDERTGLPAATCQAIAGAVIEAGRLAPGDLILEIGPGTGQIGRWFAPPLRYAGIDKSAGMLRQFRARSEGAAPFSLIRADANGTWPIVDAAARTIFSSRAMHLLDPDHAATEVLRVSASDRATLLLGRVERDPDSVRARMAVEMNHGLRRHGYEGHRGEQRNRRLLNVFQAGGARLLESFTVASWNVQSSARQSLESWRCLTGLGGIAVPPDAKERILAAVETWAEAEFDGVDRQFESEERYVLFPIRLRE